MPFFALRSQIPNPMNKAILRSWQTALGLFALKLSRRGLEDSSLMLNVTRYLFSLPNLLLSSFISLIGKRDEPHGLSYYIYLQQSLGFKLRGFGR